MGKSSRPAITTAGSRCGRQQRRGCWQRDGSSRRQTSSLPRRSGLRSRPRATTRLPPAPRNSSAGGKGTAFSPPELMRLRSADRTGSPGLSTCAGMARPESSKGVPASGNLRRLFLHRVLRKVTRELCTRNVRYYPAGDWATLRVAVRVSPLSEWNSAMFLSSWFQRLRPPSRGSRRRALLPPAARRCRPGVEPLENRRLLTTLFGVFANTGVPRKQSLVSFDSSAPGAYTGSTSITGLQPNEQILTIDFRPRTGQLYGLGSALPDAVGKHASSRIYTIDPLTGAASAVAAAFAVPLDGFAFGFSF